MTSLRTLPAGVLPNRADAEPVRHWAVHGLNLRVAAEEAIMRAIAARLHEFPPTASGTGVDLAFEFLTADDPRQKEVRRPTGSGRTVMEMTPGQVEYFEASRELWIDMGKWGSAHCDLSKRQATIAGAGTGDRRAWVCSHPFFTIPLAEFLKGSGLFMVHAASLAWNGQGILVAGESGAGKTTLALTLARAGFGFLADDTVLLRRREAEPQTKAGGPAEPRVEILAFPDEVDFTEQTASFFTELARAEEPASDQRAKRSVSASTLYKRQPVWSVAPRLLVFPEITPAAASEWAPLAKPDALLGLLCNVVRTDRASAQAHLDALGALVRQSHCLRLKVAQDFAAQPRLFREMLSTLPPSTPT